MDARPAGRARSSGATDRVTARSSAASLQTPCAGLINHLLDHLGRVYQLRRDARDEQRELARVVEGVVALEGSSRPTALVARAMGLTPSAARAAIARARTRQFLT